MIELRIDVDYPYPSRARSFIYTALNIKVGKDYLKNSKILARMINESPRKVKAYWFFTPKTIPDKELLSLLDNERHEVALHIANDPCKELSMLEQVTNRKIRYYTIHGTARFLARIMWKRWKAKAPKIPENFPLQSFYQFPTEGLDILCYNHNQETATKIAEDYIGKGRVLHIHPIWLFQRGKINRRGPYYETLRRILNADKEFETLEMRKKIFLKIARDAKEYERNVIPHERFLEKLRERGVDIFTFIERKWCHAIPNPAKDWIKVNDNVGLLQVKSYEEWWSSIGKKTRNMVRKAEKSGIKAEIVEPSVKLAEGIWKIYNETPIRQERGFPHFGTPLDAVKKMVFSSQNCTFIGAFLQEELVGFIQLVHGDNVAIISQILSLQKHWDKAVNNALVAKAVEVCADKGVQWLMYGRMGNHPSLDKFKESNGVVKFALTRYCIPLTRKGVIATKLGLHKEIKDTFPQSVKYLLIPIYNWVSRTKTKIKLLSKPAQNKLPS
ncbi:GNAT family N-acetyltransferase [Candidatus Bathyarchaeota archaeon A05DMB-5]|nr:GNAT family N-acetyltransferase [Candidatus Bathyarchaeota archaeon A05DMB-5]